MNVKERIFPRDLSNDTVPYDQQTVDYQFQGVQRKPDMSQVDQRKIGDRPLARGDDRKIVAPSLAQRP
jgi:hypothetical protein